MREADLLDLEIDRVLVVGAHPDDAEFYAGGTLARLADAGAEITLAICTDGARGGRGIDEIVRVRREEQERAAKRIGIGEIFWLKRLDGELVCDDALRGRIVREIRRARPDLVLTHDPTTLWTTHGSRTFLGHTDHRAAGQAVLDSIYPRAANPNFFPEQLRDGLALWSPGYLWLFDTARADIRIDVADGLERKLAALEEHESQKDSAGGMVRAARGLAERTGTPDRPAESFLALRLRDRRRGA